jgi:osmotically-inducible protein OsmY
MQAIVAILVGLVSGAGAMFFLDPQAGARRRSLLRGQTTKFRHRAGDTLDSVSKQVQNRAKGAVAETRKRIANEPVSDETLVERVRADMGRYVSYPSLINVNAHQGTVRLSGVILADEAKPFANAVKQMPGVRRVDNQLRIHKSADTIPELQSNETTAR